MKILALNLLLFPVFVTAQELTCPTAYTSSDQPQIHKQNSPVSTQKGLLHKLYVEQYKAINHISTEKFRLIETNEMALMGQYSSERYNKCRILYSKSVIR